jgi:hypothetical protein
MLAHAMAGELMKRFVAGADRWQWTLLPECLDDFIDENIRMMLPPRLILPYVVLNHRVVTDQCLEGRFSDT